MDNTFVIVTPSYNNSNWVEYNLASILNQTYTNWRLVYIDDCSTDDTFEKANSILKEDPRCSVIKNEINKGAAYNYIEYVKRMSLDDQDIIVHLDGDDWLYDESVLENLNNFYNEKGCWTTYGQFVCYNGSDEPKPSFPQGTPYSDYVHKYKLYRLDAWRASHLRTYKSFLWKAIDTEDLKSKIDGEYYWHASDLAWAYPALEMCPKDKIGIVNFYTHVYNATPKNQTRTREREASDNSKYEIEIRNKRKYREGINKGKMLQVLVHGDYLERHTHPTLFSYSYNFDYPEADVVYFQDDKILGYLFGSIEIPEGAKIVGRICENRKFFNQSRVVEAVLASYDRFDMILTWDEELLKLPNAVFCPLTETTQFNLLPVELPDNAFQVYPKNKIVSAVSSNKSMFPGHTTRLEFINSIRDKVDLFGRGIREIPSKLDALKDYMFSVAIENALDKNYFTEKLTDCLVTGTIPIYYGCTNIEDFFDTNGIITFSTMDELNNILDSLTPELYQSKLDSVKKNFELALNYPTDNDSMYKLYYKRYE